MKLSSSAIYISLVSFITGMACGGILIGLPQESYMAVMVGALALLIAYMIYHIKQVRH